MIGNKMNSIHIEDSIKSIKDIEVGHYLKFMGIKLFVYYVVKDPDENDMSIRCTYVTLRDEIKEYTFFNHHIPYLKRWID